MSEAVFSLDESLFHSAPADAEGLQRRLEKWLDLAEHIVVELGLRLEALGSVYAIPSQDPSIALADVVFGAQGQAAVHDFFLRLQLLLRRCELYPAAYPGPQISISRGGTSIVCASSACERAILERERTRNYYGLIADWPHQLSDELTLKLPDKEGIAYRTQQNHDVQQVLRRMMARDAVTESEFFRLAEFAFPDLYLAPGLRFNRFSKPYEAIRSDIVDHLSFLNDRFIEIAVAANWNTASIQPQCAVHGVSLSDESPNTKKNAKAMRERKVLVHGKEVTCSLHTKISPTKDRIHFHPPDRAVAGHRVIIGIFAEHLPT